MKKIIFIFVALFAVSVTYSQGLKQRVADKYYSQLSFVRAAEIYEELANNDRKVNAHILRRLADSYNKVDEHAKAAQWYQTLYESGEANLNDKYEYMLVLRKIGDYDNSLKILKEYYNTGGTDKFAEFVLANPDFVELYKQNKDRYIIKNEYAVNSEENDFGPTYYKDGILFTSPRKLPSARSFAWDETNFLDLYYADVNEEDSLSSPEKVEIEGNERFHDGPAVISPDGETLYLTRSHYVNKKGKISKSNEGIVEVNLYMARLLDDGSWGNLVPFPGSSPEYSMGNATVSDDGNIIIYASDRPGGLGESDLWMQKKESEGIWGPPVHLGEKINSARSDNFPFLDKEGNLYFASNGGQLGLGGYDVYKIPDFLNGSDKIINVGYPINSKTDDFGFIIDTEKATGYFNSNREGGNGKDDIYSFIQNVCYLKVCVVDKDTKGIIPQSTVKITTPLGDQIADMITGNSGCTAEKEVNPLEYALQASKDGYIDSEVQRVTLKRAESKTVMLEIAKEPEAPPPCPEIVLEDIYYDFDKYFIRGDASPTLDELLEFLQDFPNVKIELSSHTDSRGSLAYNDWLSQKRAESAVNYLLKRGIDPGRLKAVGYGERQLVNKCESGVPCSEREHQANRRTEITLLSDDCINVKKKPNRYQNPNAKDERDENDPSYRHAK